MKTRTAKPSSFSAGEHSIRRVDLEEPLDWLAVGVRTFAAAPASSLLYGTLFAIACWVTLALTRALPWFTIAFLTGLLLVGPFLAAGLYVAARQREAGEPISIRGGFALVWERRTNLALFAVLLALITAAWVRLSALLFAIKFDMFSPSMADYVGIVSGHLDPVTMTFFFGIGFLLAAVVFTISAVSVPMILDRDAGPITAVQTSYRAVRSNLAAMTLWAALIVAVSGIGILTLFVGMILLFPVLGYATWHSYRRLVA
jgi:uncharacterized membrane protein